MSKVNEQQIQEWVESPVTIDLFNEIEQELTALNAMPMKGCLHYGEPIKTHEALIGQDMKAFLFDWFMQVLKGDWSYFLEEEDDGYEDE